MVCGGDNGGGCVADVAVRAVVVCIATVCISSMLVETAPGECLLEWPSSEDAVTKRAEADGGLVVGLCAIVEVDFEEADVAHDWSGES